MDPAIAMMAKNNYFDAAHYTWVKLDGRKIKQIDHNEIKKLLVEHGDYATPLRTEHIRQPFDHMAVLFKYGGNMPSGIVEETYVVFTVDSNGGLLQSASLWSDLHGGDKRIMTLDFVSGKDQDKIDAIVQKQREKNSYMMDELGLVLSDTKNLLNKTLVSFHNKMPPEIRQDMMNFLIPELRHALSYIPAASAGLLAGDMPVFYRPKHHASNAKRVRKGKAPLYEWTTLELERKTPELPAAPKGGTHASPRLHQRRGHWVTSKLGKKFWRRESVVGDPEKGMIFHDYKGGETNAQTQA